MDEWVLFAAEHNLDIEKNAIIQEINKKPRKVYKLHEFMKAGAKRPSQIDPELWHSKSPAVKDDELEREIKEILKKNKQAIRTGEKERTKINKDIKRKSPRNVNQKKEIKSLFKSNEEEDTLTYE